MITIDTKATVCVIGAGIAGLVTAKTLAQDGFDRDRELLVVSLIAQRIRPRMAVVPAGLAGRNLSVPAGKLRVEAVS